MPSLPQISDDLNRLEKVGQFQQLLEIIELNSDLKNKVLQGAWDRRLCFVRALAAPLRVVREWDQCGGSVDMLPCMCMSKATPARPMACAPTLRAAGAACRSATC